MTLPSAGSISFTQIATELGTSLPLTIPSAATRTLSGVATGPIVIPTDFYGKSSGGGGGDEPPLSFIDTDSASSSTINSMSLGDAAANRRIFIAAHVEGSHSSAQSFSSLTVGATVLTIHAQAEMRHSGTNETIVVAIASAIVASGTSAAVSCSMNGGTVSSFRAGVLRAVDLANSSPLDSDAGGIIAANAPIQLSLTSGDGGFIITAAVTDDGLITSMTGPDTEAYNLSGRSAYFENDTSAGTINCSADFSGGGACAFAAVTWAG